mgnify:CR=1 FL=1
MNTQKAKYYPLSETDVLKDISSFAINSMRTQYIFSDKDFLEQNKELDKKKMVAFIEDGEKLRIRQMLKLIYVLLRADLACKKILFPETIILSWSVVRPDEPEMVKIVLKWDVDNYAEIYISQKGRIEHMLTCITNQQGETKHLNTSTGLKQPWKAISELAMQAKLNSEQ